MKIEKLFFTFIKYCNLMICCKKYRIFLLFLSGLFAACNASVEGCTDPLAKNYNPEADKDCCCTYFQLRWQLRHRASDSTGFLSETDYAYASGTDSFRVSNLRLLVSDVALLRSGGQAFGVRDSVELVLLGSGESLLLPDDFRGISPTNFIVNMGKFTDLGPYQGLRFAVGLAPHLQNIDPAALDTVHVLSSKSPYYTPSDGYCGLSLRSTAQSTGTERRFRLRDSVRVYLNYNKTVTGNADTDIPIDIRYDLLFADIDWAAGDSAAIVQQFKNNLRHAFVIRP